MSEEKRNILIQLRRAKENIEHAKSLIIQDGLTPVREFRDYILSGIDALKTTDLIIRGEGRERP